MTAWLVILTVAAGTYLFRVAMFLVVDRWSPPPRTAAALGLVAPAAIAALVASAMLTADHRVSVAPLAELLAIGAAFVVVRRTGNVSHAFFVGLPLVWALTAIGL